MANITGTTGNDELFGTSDSDTISALAGNDKVTGGLGADTLYGNEGDDEFLLGSPDIVAGEVIDGGTGTNAISIFGAANLAIFSFTNIQTLNIHHPSVTLSAAQFSSLSRIWAVSSAPSTLFAADTGTYNFSNRTVAGATFTFVGSAGDDTIIGNDAKQNIIGGLGADVLTGNNGSDVFIYRSRVESTVTQTDVITDFFKGVDKIDLTGLNFLGVTSGIPVQGWLNLTYESAANVTTLTDLGGSGFVIRLNGNHLALDNTDFIGLGSIITGSNGNDYLPGTSIEDKISGLDGNDVLQGLGGADTMLGGNGDDEFLLGFTEANGDVIDGGAGNNKISSWNADLSQATISNVQTLIANLDRFTTTSNQFAAFTNLFNYGAVAVSIRASVAGSYSFAGKNITGAFNLLGSAGDDYLAGDSKAQTLDGGDGNDVLQGLAGADVLLGGNGDDEFLVGFTEANGDVIHGGTGNNKISSWNADLSQASISNVQTLIANLDKITLTAAQFAGLSTIQNFGSAPVAILAATSGSYNLASKDTTGLFNLVGSAGNDLLIGNAAAQTLTGGLGADTVTGNAGTDVFVYKSREESTAALTDVITDFVEGIDKIDLTNLGFRGITTGTPDSSQLKISYDAVDDSTTIADLSGSNFSIILQGNHLTLSDPDFIGLDNFINGTSDNDYLPGTAQQDVIYGLDGDDIMQGLGRADTMFGGNGNDEFLVGFDEALGDVIDGGTDLNKISSWNADLSQATISNVQILIANLDRVKITDQQLNSLSYIINYGDIPVTIQAGIVGSYDFSFKSLLGSFSFVGSTGADTLRGGFGVNYLHGGDGDDTIRTSRDGRVEQLFGDAGNDTFIVESYPAIPLAGTTLDGGTGYNTITGEWLRLYDFDFTNIQHLNFRNSVLISAEQFSQLTTFSGFGVVYGAFAGTYDMSNKTDLGYTLVNFEGSGENDVIIGHARTQTINGNDGDDTIYGGDGNDTIVGGNGYDTIYGGEIDDVIDGDVIFGEGGNDAMYAEGNNIQPIVDNYFDGGEGNDLFNGRGGNDTLIGGSGNDRYIFSGGTTSITDSDTTSGNSDVVNFTGSVEHDQIWFSRSGNDLIAEVIGTDDQVTIVDWYLGNDNHVEQFTAYGLTLLDSQVQNLVNAMAAFAVPTTTTLPPDYSAVLDPIIAANWT